jgi:hypothetical protein
VTGDVAITHFEEIIGTSTLARAQLRMMWGNVGYSVLAWFCIWACLMFGTRRPLAALVSLTMGIPIIVFAVFFDQESHLPVLRRIRFTLGVGCFCTTERGDVFSSAALLRSFLPRYHVCIMTAFGPYCKRHEPAFVNSMVITPRTRCFLSSRVCCLLSPLGTLFAFEGVE